MRTVCSSLGLCSNGFDSSPFGRKRLSVNVEAERAYYITNEAATAAAEIGARFKVAYVQSKVALVLRLWLPFGKIRGDIAGLRIGYFSNKATTSYILDAKAKRRKKINGIQSCLDVPFALQTRSNH